MDRTLLERLRRLKEDLGDLFDESVDLRRAAGDPDHPRNQWPAVERRAASRDPYPRLTRRHPRSDPGSHHSVTLASCPTCEAAGQPVYTRFGDGAKDRSLEFRCPYCGTEWTSRDATVRARSDRRHSTAPWIGSERRKH